MYLFGVLQKKASHAVLERYTMINCHSSVTRF